jgi:AAA ATPase domain
LFGLLDLPLRDPVAADASVLLVHAGALLRAIALGIALGIAFGIALGILLGISRGISAVIAAGIAVGIAIGIGYVIAAGLAFGIAEEIAGEIAAGISAVIAAGIAIGIAFGTDGGVPIGIITGIALGIIVAMASVFSGGMMAGGIAVGIDFGIAGGIAVGIAAGIAVLRAYYQPLHLWFVWPALQARWYRFHPVAWDDLCSLHFPGLHRLLVAYADVSPEAGNAEIERLISSYPSQRMQALRARTILLAREAGAQRDLTRLDAIVGGLPEGDRGFLAQTSQVREMVSAIAASQSRLDTIDRAFMREPYASLLVKEIENFQGRVSGFHEPLASEFPAAADNWLGIAERQLSEIQSIVGKDPTPQVFRAGDPVDRAQEAYVPRMNMLGQLERQVMLATGCPGLLIYGRRRMGKSTLLRNLDGFLPGSVRIISISMQNPAAFTSISSLCRLIMEETEKSGIRAGAFADGARFGDGATWNDSASSSQSEDLSSLFRILDSANAALERENKRLVLAFDEFEQFDIKIGDGIFNQDLLSTIRESIQMHRRLIWIFAGSHHITELKHAPWDSYLVSVRTIEVQPFSEAETRLLLTEPLRESDLFRDDEARRPRFDAAFWGDHGIEWIHREAGGWPHLVQLLAGTAVDLVNEANVESLDGAMLERAAEKSIIDGDTVLRQLMRGESEIPCEWEYLTGFRSKDQQSSPSDEAIFQSLRRRQLISEDSGMWRLRVPLMQRWLRQRG